MLQRVDHGDVRLDLDGLAVENGGTVAPLAHGVGGGLQEERVAAYDLQRLNRAVRRDDCVHFHLAFAMNLPRECGIDGLDAVEQHRRFEVTDEDTHWRSRRWRRRWLMPVVIERDAPGAGRAWPRP